MSTTVTMTLAEFSALPDEPGKCELLQGELIRMPPPKKRHGMVQERAVAILSEYINRHGGGRVFTNVGFRMANDTCLEPDVAFVRDAQIARTKLDDWFHGAPALAVEVISPANRAAKLEQKVRVYLDNGAEAVWVIDPIRKRLTAYRPGGHFEMFELPSGQVADASIFPGLHIELAALFEGLG